MHVKSRLMGSDEDHSDLTNRRARMWGVRGGDGWVGEGGGGGERGTMQANTRKLEI
jgi:hypothetical protein